MAAESMDRRTFLGSAAGFVAMAGLALAGCESSGPESASDGETSSSDSATTAPESSSSHTPGSGGPEEGTASTSEERGDGKSAIVLWSWSGNTLKMAERISELSGTDIYRIEAAESYPDDYDATADRAKQEQDEGVYPEIANPISNWDDYDIVFLGYPIWWYELPMIVQGFVRDHDWAGKTLVPFNSHEGSGDGGTYDDLRNMTGAEVLDGLPIRGGDVESSLGQVDEWYAGLGL